MARTLVIGDIHGALKALTQVLQKAGVTAEDKLIFLGDYVDGWSESAGVVDYLLELTTRQQCIFIKGNHDEWCEQWLQTGIVPTGWLHSGGVQTLQSYTLVDAATKRAHLLFFERMVYYIMDEQNRLFLHAGFTSPGGPRFEDPVNTCAWDRSLWELAIMMNDRASNDTSHYPKRLKLFTEIFIGHTPTLRLNTNLPVQACNIWNIDTGAGFTGKLTLMDVENKEYWQSDEVPDLYPGEKGRNR